MKNTFKKLVLSIITAIISLQLMGCASYLTYQHNKKNMIRENLFRAGDSDGLRAFDNGVYAGPHSNIAINEVLSSNIGSTALAGGVDLISLLGAIYLADEAGGSSSKNDVDNNGDNITLENSDNANINIIEVNGNGNDVTGDGGSSEDDLGEGRTGDPILL